MAKSTKASSKGSAKSKTKAEVKADVEDAVILPEEDETAKALAEEIEQTKDALSADAVSDDTPAETDIASPDDTVTDAGVSDAPVEDVLTEATTEESASSSPEETPAPIPPAPVAQEVTVKKVGLLPTVGGGVIAAGLGYFAATQGIGQSAPDLTPLLDEQAAQIEALDAAVAAIPPAPELPELPEMPDLAPLEESLAALQDEASAQFGAIGEQLNGFEERLTAVERAPTEEGGVSDTAITSFERELDGLRTEIAAQETRIQEMADQAAADLEAAQAQTAAVEAEAQAAAEAARAEAEAAQAEAEAAMAAAAVAEVRVAMDSGEPFADALADLEAAGVEVPEAIAAVAEDGLPTEADLASQFPALAREALSVARSEGGGEEEEGGVGSFLRNQFNVRSVEPREGDDPDAVLSRAEAALRGGDLDATLTEVSALPETARATFADWLAAAEARKDALAAISTLASTDEN